MNYVWGWLSGRMEKRLHTRSAGWHLPLRGRRQPGHLGSRDECLLCGWEPGRFAFSFQERQQLWSSAERCDHTSSRAKKTHPLTTRALVNTFTLLVTDATSPCKNLPLWLLGAPRAEARAALAGVGVEERGSGPQGGRWALKFLPYSSPLRLDSHTSSGQGLGDKLLRDTGLSPGPSPISKLGTMQGHLLALLGSSKGASPSQAGPHNFWVNAASQVPYWSPSAGGPRTRQPGVGGWCCTERGLN